MSINEYLAENNITDNTTRRMITEGYNATVSLGLQSLFENNVISENFILTDNRFPYLAREILNQGGTDHTGASFGFLCGQLSNFFRATPPND